MLDNTYNENEISDLVNRSSKLDELFYDMLNNQAKVIQLEKSLKYYILGGIKSSGFFLGVIKGILWGIAAYFCFGLIEAIVEGILGFDLDVILYISVAVIFIIKTYGYISNELGTYKYVKTHDRNSVKQECNNLKEKIIEQKGEYESLKKQLDHLPDFIIKAYENYSTYDGGFQLKEYRDELELHEYYHKLIKFLKSNYDSCRLDNKRWNEVIDKKIRSTERLAYLNSK